METSAPQQQNALDNLEGEIISGRYKIIRRVGKGGMGVVYLAQQTNLNRNVCLKVLNPILLDDADAVSRFEREAKGLSRLQHPNIVTIFDYGRDGNLAYIVMEYAQGETLGKYLKAHGALTLDEFLPIAVQTLKGIAEAHKMGLIHRDIKPANIVLCELEGEKNFVKILDFGLAKLAQGGEDLTKEQQLVGSASYMSPEQILSGISDTRTDVYALGVMFYLMLAGQKPFTGSTDNAILYQHVNNAPKPLRLMVKPEQNIPETLCEVIDQCLEKDAQKRPQTALDLLNAISYALDAPQIMAGYSSMSLAKVELQKVTEEGENHPSAPPMPPVPVSNDVDSDSESSVSYASAVSGVGSHPIDVSSISLMQQNNYARDARDRKILVIVLLCVAVIAAVVITAIVFHPSEQTSPGQTAAQDKSLNEGLETLYARIEENIRNNQWDDAQDQVNTLEAKASPDTPDLLLKIDDYNTLIKRGKLLSDAREKVNAGQLEEAIELYETLLKKDKDNISAQNELDAAKQALERIPVLRLELPERTGCSCTIDEDAVGEPPESIRLETGTHNIQITCPEYKPWEKKIMLEPSDKLTLQVHLEKMDAAPAPRPAQHKSSGASHKSSNSSKTESDPFGIAKPKKGKKVGDFYYDD